MGCAHRPVGRLRRGRHLARTAAANAFAHFPVPSRSTRIPTAPRHAPTLGHLAMAGGYIDPTLTRTGWWLVRLPYTRLVRWYAARVPVDVRSTYLPNSAMPAPQAEFSWVAHGRAVAYSQPVSVVAYVRLGRDLTAMRTDVTLAARFDRSAQTRVPTSVTSIDVIKRAIDGDDTTPRTVTVVDRGTIRSVVRAFNGLRGDYARPGYFGCGSPVGIVYSYAVTFRWPGHTLAVDAGEPLCGIGRSLVRDGHRLPQRLQSDGSFDDALAAAFRG